MSGRTVAHLVTSLQTGGTERQLVELVRRLDPERFRPRVACFRKAGVLLDELRALGVEPVEVSLGGSFLRLHTAAVALQLAGWLVREEARVLHCHDVFSDMLGVPAAHLAKIPVIASRRDLAHHLTSAQRGILRLALAGATRVLANAHAVAAQAEREDGVPASRLAVIPNGIDLAHFDERARRLEAPAPSVVAGKAGVRTILKVGRFTHPAKGHDDFLAAAARVHARAPDVRFLLVGDGPREPELRALAGRLGLGEAAVFLGKRFDVPALLSRATIACHAAHAEGLPNAVMEAMAARRPLVATAVGGTPDLVEHGAQGLLVPPRRPAALADALLSLLEDPARAARLGEHARARLAREYGAERLAERVGALYDELCPPEERPPGAATG